jgi:hypothetical protein
MYNSVAAIHLKDGTSIPIAQIQGSSQYQAFMRGNTAPGTAEDSTVCQWLSPTLDRLTSAFGLDIDICREDVTGTKALLSSLKTVVEAYLGTNICFASLSHDDVLGYQMHGYKVEAAEKALQALGLRQVMPSVPVAKSIIRTYMPSENLPEFDEEPWVVLTVEYSEHWFNVGLYTIEEEGIVSPIHGWVKELRVGEQNQLETLRDRLRDIIASPPPGVDLPQQIRHLYIHGNDAKNDALKPMLASMLGEDLVGNAQVSDSVYTSVRYIADSCHVAMVFDMDTEAAFGCKWRSKLYREERTEL